MRHATGYATGSFTCYVPVMFSGSNLICIRGERRIFAGLSFSVPAGGALLLVGRNGAGKSSLLRMMAGLLPPFGGNIAWNGEDVRTDPENHARRTHYAGHQDAIKPMLSTRQNIAFWAAIRTERGDESGAADQRILEAQQRLDLSELSAVQGRLLSAGQKRRTALARLAASPTKLWLLDEPSAALDHASTRALTKMIADHRATGGIVVASTHTDLDIPDAQTLDMDSYKITKGTPSLADADSW